MKLAVTRETRQSFTLSVPLLVKLTVTRDKTKLHVDQLSETDGNQRDKTKLHVDQLSETDVNQRDKTNFTLSVPLFVKLA